MASTYNYHTIVLSLLLLLHSFQHKGIIRASKFTFVNKCTDTIWPAILGTPALDTTGFQLPRGASRAFQGPTGWSGRFWGRTGCAFDQSGRGSCATGDCGSGQIECNGAGATAATLVEFTLGAPGSMDFYDVSLVDGYNLPLTVDAAGASGGECASTGCAEDLNRRCPAELRTGGGGACMSACGAFGTEEYCCKGEYGSPATCRPSAYSKVFKSACPDSYSYAYDDATSTFTCTGADYVITFCPSISKSVNDTGSGGGSTDGSGSGSGSESGVSFSGSGQEAISADGSWMADLATGGSSRTQRSLPILLIAVVHLAAAVVPLLVVT